MPVWPTGAGPSCATACPACTGWWWPWAAVRDTPGSPKQAQGRTGDTPSRSGPASHRARSHAPYATWTDQEEHKRPSPLRP